MVAHKPQAGVTIAAPNVIPMADIMLVLLIIFMVVTPMLRRPVDLARVDNPAYMPNAEADDAITVTVARDGRIFISAAQIAEDQVTATIKSKVADRTDKRIYIESDRRAKYVDVTKIVDDVRSAGVDQVGLLTERIEHQGAIAPAPAGQR
jgi:biopolymer transport protein TolR